MFSKLVAFIAIFAFMFLNTVYCMVYGYGLEVKSWFTLFTSFVVTIILTLISQIIMKEE